MKKTVLKIIWHDPFILGLAIGIILTVVLFSMSKILGYVSYDYIEGMRFGASLCQK